MSSNFAFIPPLLTFAENAATDLPSSSNVIAAPWPPNRAALPMRWKYVSASTGDPILMTRFTFEASTPLAV